MRYAHRYIPLPLVPTYPVWYPAAKLAGILGISGMPNLSTAYSVEIMNTNSLPRLDSDCLFCTDIRGNIYSGRERSRGQ